MCCRSRRDNASAFNRNSIHVERPAEVVPLNAAIQAVFNEQASNGELPVLKSVRAKTQGDKNVSIAVHTHLSHHEKSLDNTVDHTSRASPTVAGAYRKRAWSPCEPAYEEHTHVYLRARGGKSVSGTQ